MSDLFPSTSDSRAEIGRILRTHQSFVLISHVRPDGDAIGSVIGLGFSLMEMGKQVVLLNEDGVPQSLSFLKGAEQVSRSPSEPLEVEVAIALDTANKDRLGEKSLHAASEAALWINIDHHKSNPGYGDVNLIDSASPSTGELVYSLIKELDLPLPGESRDAIYVANSTDTGSFQYPATRATTFEMAADLVRRGLDVGAINNRLYHDYPFRRVELLRALLDTMERSDDGWVAHWELTLETKKALGLAPDDSEGLIGVIRGIHGVRLAVYFEELADGKIRVSMRSQNPRLDVCAIAQPFGGGGHSLAAGVRMKGPLEQAKSTLLAAIRDKVDAVKSTEG